MSPPSLGPDETTAQQPRDAARLADQLAAARRAAADAERAEQVNQRSDGQGGQQTTITTNGKKTTISTDRNGVTRITGEDGQVTVIDPQAIAEQAARAATSTGQPRGPFGPVGPMGPRGRFGDGPFQPDGGPPDGVIRLITTVLSIFAIIIIGFPISRAFARRMDRKSTVPPQDPDVARRLDRIEQAIETVAVEMERVSEAQRYAAKLLTDRLPESPARAIAGADQLSR